MKVDQRGRIEELFERALDLAAEDRARFLDEECREDRELRDEVASLLLHSATVEHPLGLHVLEAVRSLVGRVAIEQLGRRVGSYRLIEELGKGGMGVVYLAEHDDDDAFSHRVAIKLLSDEVASRHAISRFYSERQILAGLEHPNIVRLLGGGSIDGMPFLMMEYIVGTGIAQFAETQELSVRARVALVRQVCAALQYAHERRVIHRDIKPSNILVDRNGVAKVLDFGIAKLLTPDGGFAGEAHTSPGFPLFTPGYASPEQARGEVVSPATDLYSTGAVLYHLMTGRTPHQITGTQLEMLLSICGGDPPPPSAVAPRPRRRELVGDLDHIILKALHKDPAQRYATMAHLDAALGRWLDGLPAIDRRAGVLYRARKFVARNRRRVGAALAAMATLALALSLTARAVQLADERAAQAEEELHRAQRAAERERLRAARARESEEAAQIESGMLRAKLAIHQRALHDKMVAEQRARPRLANERRATSLAARERREPEQAQAGSANAHERARQPETPAKSRPFAAHRATLTTLTVQP